MHALEALKSKKTLDALSLSGRVVTAQVRLFQMLDRLWRKSTEAME